ncbi:MAG TPA: SDR family oxidoreductase, partial [Planctomycetaceae bacterium]|nr:SDR family oxidoreductase [Planctomycetaceae bacterium]
MTTDLFDLSGRVALVSGAAQGLGRAMSIALAEFGADLMLADLNDEGLTRTAETIRAIGRRAVPVRCDVSQPEQIRPMFAQLDREWGRIDFLANVAGEGLLGKPEEISLEDLERTWRNLVFGRFCMCQEAGRRMLKQGRGSIVNIGSIASQTALGRGHIAYSMAMGSVVQMTRELSTEWSSGGVRVNSILPAQVVNPSLEKRMTADPTL